MALSRTIFTPVNHAGAIYQLKEHLKAGGFWTVVESGDGGSIYSSSSDIITHVGTGANGMDNLRAWFRLQATNGIEIIVQRGTGAAPANRFWRGKYSPSSGFTGGSPDATTTSSATDEANLVGGGTDASPTYLQLRSNGTASAIDYRIISDDSTGSFIMFGLTSTNLTDNAFVHDAIDPAAGDIYGSVFYIPQNAGGSGNVLSDSSDLGITTHETPKAPIAIMDTGGGPIMRTMPGATLAVRNTVGTLQAVASDANANVQPNNGDGLWPLMPLFYMRPEVLASPHGFKGVSKIFRWLTDTTTAGDTLYVDNATAPEWIACSAELACFWGGAAAATNLPAKDFAPGGAADVTPPTISNILPTPGTSVAKGQSITFDVDDETGLALVLIFVSYADGSTEIIHDGFAFRDRFRGGVNLRTATGTGYSFTLAPDGGWTAAPTIEWAVLDTGASLGAIV